MIVIGVIVGLGLLFLIARGHVEHGGQITVGGLVFAVIMALIWFSHVQDEAACQNGDEAVCARIGE